MSVVELNTIAGVRQYLSYKTLEFQHFFLGHVMFLLNDQPNAARVEHGRAPAGLSAVCEGNSPYRSGCLVLYMLALANFNPDGLAKYPLRGNECRRASD